jgi:heme a synthase
LRTDFIKPVTVEEKVGTLTQPSVGKSIAANFTVYAWSVLGWNLLVVLWGAFVRATSSGAGCGGHWPLCNGEVVPHAPQIATLIEYIHRFTSGVAFFAVVGLVAWSIARYPKNHRVRLTATASFAFFITEAALGAGLVLFDFVGGDASAARALYLSMHLVNTAFLLAALVLTAWFAQNPDRTYSMPPLALMLALPAALLVMTTGGIAALGDTLFPASSLAEGLRQDLSVASNFLVRLRALHPGFAVFSAVLFIAAAYRFLHSTARQAARLVIWFTILQIILGSLNIVLLAPTWMQIIHLLVADLVWLSLVILMLEASRAKIAPAIDHHPAPVPSPLS